MNNHIFEDFVVFFQPNFTYHFQKNPTQPQPTPFPPRRTLCCCSAADQVTIGDNTSQLATYRLVVVGLKDKIIVVDPFNIAFPNYKEN